MKYEDASTFPTNKVSLRLGRFRQSKILLQTEILNMLIDYLEH